MSHEICANDQVFSIQGTEWHGLAQHVEVIGKTELDFLSFPIIESPATVQVDGKNYTFPDHKIIMADLRGREFRTDDILPLNTPKAGYTVIENARVFDMVQNALSNVGFEISTVGTLGDCRRLFLSVVLNDSKGAVINGDKFDQYVNFVTSHDGTLSLQAYDSNVRIVCQNTLNASQWHKGDLRLHVKHTKNANDAIGNMEKTLQEILRGREKFALDMSFLASLGADYYQAQSFVAGYFSSVSAKNVLSSRAKNATDEIVSLYQAGRGNNGKTFYDVFNGATEYFTSGNGTGATASNREKATAAAFGMASNHKQAIAAAMLNDDKRGKLIELGKQAYAAALA